MSVTPTGSRDAIGRVHHVPNKTQMLGTCRLTPGAPVLCVDYVIMTKVSFGFTLRIAFVSTSKRIA